MEHKKVTKYANSFGSPKRPSGISVIIFLETFSADSPEKTDFSRKDKNFLRIKITAEDAPMVYYKMVNAFDQANVNIQQAVISTIGHQVIDTFYILPSDQEKIIGSDFEESIKRVLMGPSEI